MHVSKWGNSLAVRLPAELVGKMGVKDGDEVDVKLSHDGQTLEISRKLTLDERFERIRHLAGRMPADFKFDRDEANER
jgi:antitoxin MazE